MLTVATAYLRPKPFLMTKDLLWRLESAVVEAGRHSMHDIYELEQRIVRAGLNSVSEFQAHIKEILDIHAVLKRYNVDSIAELEARVLRAGKGGVDALGHELHSVRSRLQASMQHNWRSLQAATGLLDIRCALYAFHNSGGALEKNTCAAFCSPHMLQRRWPTARWPVYVFLAGAMVCLLTSTVCHTLGCCSQHVALWIWRVDYCGIAVLIVASFYPPVYYCFQCQSTLKWAYLGFTTAMGMCLDIWNIVHVLSRTCTQTLNTETCAHTWFTGVGAVCVSLMPIFQTTEYRAFRAAMFAGLGLWGLVPMAHGIMMYWGQPEVERALLLDLLMGAIYLLGAGVYAMRVPERWKPGAFDIAFHSHQLFHVAVVLAAAVHYKAVLILLRWRDAALCV